MRDASKLPFLKVLHSDILLPGEAEDAPRAHDALDASLPPTRTDEHSRYVLTEEACAIGRHPDCAIRIRRTRTDVSRSHATIRREGDRFRLHDHSSRGTFVNDRRIDAPYQLETGDMLGFGESPRMLRFVDPARPGVELTARERDILRLIADGQTNKQVAAALHISPETVNTHLQHIYEKLGVSSRTEAAMRARAKGILDEPVG